MAVLALSACKDELEEERVIGMPGYLTFDVSDNHSWGENAITRSGVEAPIRRTRIFPWQPPQTMHDSISKGLICVSAKNVVPLHHIL